MKAIIAVGGKGTRLLPLTYSTNKQMIPIANKPLLMYPLQNVIDAGIKEVGLIVNETRSSVEEFVGDGSRFGLHVTYIDQSAPLGLAHVVKISEEFLAGEPFVYLLGDNIFTAGIKKPLQHFIDSDSDAVLSIVEHAENFRMGVPFFDNEGKLIEVVEKPLNPPNRFCVPGMYMFTSKVFEAFKGKDAIKPSARGELEIVDLYNYMLRHGMKVEVAEIEGHWRDPGKFGDALETNKLLLELNPSSDVKGEVDKDSKLIDGVILGKGSKIINSQIIGPVIIGENVEIRNSFVGSYTAIGDDCELVNCKIEYSILLEDVHITDVKGKIEGAMIGNHSEISTTKQLAPSYSFMVADHCRIHLPF